ncbi:hypothetical protein [Sphingomonas sp.]|uniref:hypothetical protein n=1 Tax=Sphingomonas sp. TaxID=28214 RepID=UPI001B17A4B7|nr:hypothetical protein [Sphingomonas sp.]MBO9714807.1 hypothetical protein [Sphingomonas sp.]
MARLRACVPILFLLMPMPAFAQRLGGGSDLNLSLTRIVMTLLLCLMIAGLAALLLKRSGGRIDLAALRRLTAAAAPARRIDVVETRRISQHADVCLFRCDGQEYLVLCAEQHLTVLRDAPVAEKPE